MKVAYIALYTFRDAVRNKILYSIIFFALVLIALSVVLGSASLAQDARLVRNLGLGALFFFSNAIAILVGVNTVFQELERKTIYAVLSKPIARWKYYFGKFLGMVLTMAVQVAIMSSAFLVVMGIRGDAVSAAVLGAIWLIFVGNIAVLSFASFFSSFSTPYVSGFMTGGLWAIGSLLPELERYLPRLEPGFTKSLLQGVVTVVPDLDTLNISTQLNVGYPVELEYFVAASLYALAYAGAFLFAGALIFMRRDFL